MSKFFITNNSDLYKRIRGKVETSDYKISFESKESGVYALSTKKLAVDNINGTQCDDGFVIVTGTMAWGGGEPVNSNTLHCIYDTFTGDVSSIQKNTIGSFGVVVHKSSKTYVFGEIAGFYNIYYYSIDGIWLVSNSLYEMAVALKGKITLNKLALIEYSVQDGILLDDTLFNEIHRLSGFNHLIIDNDVLKVIEEECDYPLCEGSLDEKVKHFVELQQNYGLRMHQAYGVPTISMTGGLDARMAMSTYLSVGVKPCLYYGVGNSFITNTFNQDKEIDEQFSVKFGLPLFIESWNTPERIDEYWKINLEKYGFYYDTYAGSKDVIESIINNPNILFTYGYCGELYRNLPWVESRKKDYFTIDEYINEVYVTSQVRESIINKDEYYSFIKNKQLRICEHYHLDPNHIVNEDIFYLSLERRKSADSAMLNHVNMIKYCCYTIGQYESLAAGRVSCKEAKNSSFMLRCLDALYPEVLEVPVFSHCTMRDFYRETMSLSSQNSNCSAVKSLLKEVMKNYLPFVVAFFRNVISQKKGSRYHNVEADRLQVTELYKKYDTLKVVNGEKIADLRRLINYIMKVYALNRIGIEA